MTAGCRFAACAASAPVASGHITGAKTSRLLGAGMAVAESACAAQRNVVLQELDLENRGRLMGAAEPGQLDAFRKVLQEEYDVRTHRSVADEVGRLDHSLREVVSQQLSHVLKEITNRDDTARALEAKLEAQRRMLREDHEAQVRRQAAESEAAAKARVEALQAEAMANVDECQRKAAEEQERLLEVRVHGRFGSRGAAARRRLFCVKRGLTCNDLTCPHMKAFSLQVQNELIGENERLQERIDELGADVYLLRQENTDLSAKQEQLDEVRGSRALRKLLELCAGPSSTVGWHNRRHQSRELFGMSLLVLCRQSSVSGRLDISMFEH